jgi:hypothetical protein
MLEIVVLAIDSDLNDKQWRNRAIFRIAWSKWEHAAQISLRVSACHPISALRIVLK